MKLKRLLFGLGLALLLIGLALCVHRCYAGSIIGIRAKAEKGDAKAQCELGKALFLDNYGKLTLAKNVEAVKWFRKAAEQNYPEAQFWLGNSCDEDEAEAMKWHRKAAEQNNVGAQDHLGHCYAFGKGVEKDQAEAVKWYRKAAEQNHVGAQQRMGFHYQYGEGVAKDDMEAARWYRKAAEQNDLSAQVSLGYCYRYGKGVAKDDVEAYKWAHLAANAYTRKYREKVYYEPGKLLQDRLETGMTSTQIAMGKLKSLWFYWTTPSTK